MVPFAALHDGQDWLLGRVPFTYLTSGTSLLQPRVHEPRNRSVVIFADPVFQTSFAPAFANRSLVTSGGPTPGFAPLAGTRMEAKAIQGLWRTANLFLGAQATKATLLDLHAPGILHLATHGVFLPGITPALVRSALALAPSPGGPGARREDDRSSLVSALEVTSMDLWGTQLVVLSACESGIGDVQRGEGVVGLRRSFFVAGTETLVSSLWTQYIWVVRLQGPLRVEVSKLKTLCEHLKRTRTWPSRHRSR